LTERNITLEGAHEKIIADMRRIEALVTYGPNDERLFEFESMNKFCKQAYLELNFLHKCL